MLRRHVIEIKAEIANTPMQAYKTLKRLSQMMDLAVDLEWRTDNPLRGVKRFPISSQSFHTWDESEIDTFYKAHSIRSVAQRAMTLMRYTGAAKCDAVSLGKAPIRDGRIVYRRRKTKKNPDGFAVNIPVHPYLAATLAHVPVDRAGLPRCSSHGLRKAICRRIAEVEGDVFKVIAASGHTDIKEAQKYCDRFNRKGKADSAIAGLPDGAKFDTT